MENNNMYFVYFKNINPLLDIKTTDENDNYKLINISDEVLNIENEWQQEYELIYLSHKLESN